MVEGIFGLSPAKQEYYSASSLMWLPDRPASAIAKSSAIATIGAWQHELAGRWSLDDEVLTHVYLATARLKLGDIDGAMESVRPIMRLPEERQTSWIRDRIANLGDIRDTARYRAAASAADAREELRAFSA